MHRAYVMGPRVGAALVWVWLVACGSTQQEDGKPSEVAAPEHGEVRPAHPETTDRVPEDSVESAVAPMANADPPVMAFRRDGKTYVADLDGGNARRVLDEPISDLAPDGVTALVNSFADDGPRVATANLATQQVTRVAGIPDGLAQDAIFWNQGRRILFSILQHGDWRLAEVSSNGTGFRLIDLEGHECKSPRATQGGVICRDSQSGHLELTPHGTVRPYAITEVPELNSSRQTWARSPNAEHIAFSMPVADGRMPERFLEGKRNELRVLRVADGRQTTLTTNQLAVTGRFHWVDGSTIYFVAWEVTRANRAAVRADRPVITNIYRVSIENSQPTVVVANADRLMLAGV